MKIYDVTILNLMAMLIIQAHSYLEVRAMANVGREGILSSKWLTQPAMCIYYCDTSRAYFTNFVLLPHDIDIMNFPFANLSELSLLILDGTLLPCSFHCYSLLKSSCFVSLGYVVILSTMQIFRFVSLGYGVILSTMQIFHYTSARFISLESFYLACKCLSKSNVIMGLKIIVHVIVNS